jgi:hypothetical protein
MDATSDTINVFDPVIIDNIAMKRAANLTFIEVLFAIVIAWLMVALWEKVIDNLAYHTIGLNPNSTTHSFMVALTVTVIFIAYALLFNDATGGIIEGNIEGDLPGTIDEPGGLVDLNANSQILLDSAPSSIPNPRSRFRRIT